MQRLWRIKIGRMSCRKSRSRYETLSFEDEQWLTEMQEKLTRLAREAAIKKAISQMGTERASPLSMKRQESGMGRKYTIIEAEAPTSPTALQSSP